MALVLGAPSTYMEKEASPSRAFRDELQHFASTLLRQEIADGCDQLRQSLVQELHEMHLHAKGGEMQGLVLPSPVSARSHISSGDGNGTSEHHRKDVSFARTDVDSTYMQPSSTGRHTELSRHTSAGHLIRLDPEDSAHLAHTFQKTLSRVSTSNAIERFAKREVMFSQEFHTPESRHECFALCKDKKNLINAIIGFTVFLNAIFIGVQTDHQARRVTHDVPTMFNVMEITFFCIFASDLIRNWREHGLRFYYMPGCSWNYFDTVLVLLQTFDTIGIFLESGDAGVSFIRVLRVLRLFRILRVVRLVRFVDQLDIMLTSILSSAQSLLWTVLLLLIMMYMFGILFCQIVFMHRIDIDGNSDELEMWWGSLFRAILSLYQAILGGVDWDVLLRPMIRDITPLLGVLFCAYIAFAVLAVMNVITGTFVQSSLRDSTMKKARDFTDAARAALSADRSSRHAHQLAEVDMVSHDAFLRVLSDTKFTRWLGHMSIEVEQAMLLFHMLQRAEGVDGCVESESLVHGLSRMGESAKFMDVMKLMHEHHRNQKKFNGIERRLDNIGTDIAWKVMATFKGYLEGEFESLLKAVKFNQLSV